MKVIVPAFTACGFAIAGVSVPTSALAQGWQRITTEQQYRERIVDRQILTTEGNRFTSHADGRVTGEWSGQQMVGGWQCTRASGVATFGSARTRKPAPIASLSKYAATTSVKRAIRAAENPGLERYNDRGAIRTGGVRGGEAALLPTTARP